MSPLLAPGIFAVILPIFLKPVNHRTLPSLISRMATTQPRKPKRFAPLDPHKKGDRPSAPGLKGIVFDVDGTLW